MKYLAFNVLLAGLKILLKQLPCQTPEEKILDRWKNGRAKSPHFIEKAQDFENGHKKALLNLY